MLILADQYQYGYFHSTSSPVTYRKWIKPWTFRFFIHFNLAFYVLILFFTQIMLKVLFITSLLNKTILLIYSPLFFHVMTIWLTLVLLLQLHVTFAIPFVLRLFRFKKTGVLEKVRAVMMHVQFVGLTLSVFVRICIRCCRRVLWWDSRVFKKMGALIALCVEFINLEKINFPCHNPAAYTWLFLVSSKRVPETGGD